jgi:hypothetical protein
MIMNILERLNSALKNDGKLILEVKHIKTSPDQPGTEVDMSDPYSRMAGLANCRGPSVGWADYAAGRDYVPPLYFEKGSTLEIGPKDTGKTGIIAPVDTDEKEIKFDGPNPYSYKHGGIRPWSPGEVIQVFLQKGYDKESSGLLRKLARKNKVSNAAVATHGKQDAHDIRDAMAVGAMATMQALPDDEAREGIRFTAYIGTYIQQAMLAGAPPGYSDEYRRTRGLRRALEPVIKRAIVHAREGSPLLTEPGNINGKAVESDLDSAKEAFKRLDVCPKCGGTGQVMGYKVWTADDEENDSNHKEGEYAVDRTGKKIPEKQDCKRCIKGSTAHIPPGPKHPYGRILKDLLELKTIVIRAITSKNAGEIQQAYVKMQEVFGKLGEEESTFKTTGTTTGGAIGKKPREHGTLNAYNRASIFLDDQRKFAERAAEILESGVSDREWDKVIAAAAQQYEDFRTPEHKKWIPDPDDPNQKEPLYVSPFAKRQDDIVVREKIQHGSIGLIAITEKLVEILKSRDLRELKDFGMFSLEQQRLIRDREQAKLQSTKATSMDVNNDDDDSEGTERTDVYDRGDTDLHDKMHEVATIAVAKLSPYRDDSIERKEQAKAANSTLDAIKSTIDSYTKIKSINGDVSGPIQTFERIAKSLDIQQLGDEWYENVGDILGNIKGALEMDTGLKDDKRDITHLQQVAKQDTRLEQPKESLTPQEYRIALRMLGISDYPEKGTPQDPEIDEHGQKSKWAERGYVPVFTADPGRKQDLFLWTDVFETTDENGNPTPSVSNARISTVKRSAEIKIGQMIAQIRQEIGEEFGYDSIDYQIISESYIAFCYLVVEEAFPGLRMICD